MDRIIEISHSTNGHTTVVTYDNGEMKAYRGSEVIPLNSAEQARDFLPAGLAQAFINEAGRNGSVGRRGLVGQMPGGMGYPRTMSRNDRRRPYGGFFGGYEVDTDRYPVRPSVGGRSTTGAALTEARAELSRLLRTTGARPDPRTVGRMVDEIASEVGYAYEVPEREMGSLRAALQDEAETYCSRCARRPMGRMPRGLRRQRDVGASVTNFDAPWNPPQGGMGYPRTMSRDRRHRPYGGFGNGMVGDGAVAATNGEFEVGQKVYHDTYGCGSIEEDLDGRMIAVFANMTLEIDPLNPDPLLSAA